jgi:hypothetical protein
MPEVVDGLLGGYLVSKTMGEIAIVLLNPGEAANREVAFSDPLGFVSR